MGSSANPSLWEGDDLPVERVTWVDAMSFAKKLGDSALAANGGCAVLTHP